MALRPPISDADVCGPEPYLPLPPRMWGNGVRRAFTPSDLSTHTSMCLFLHTACVCMHTHTHSASHASTQHRNDIRWDKSVTAEVDQLLKGPFVRRQNASAPSVLLGPLSIKQLPGKSGGWAGARTGALLGGRWSPPALNLAWRSQTGLLSSSCVIREYFWDWQRQAPLPLRAKPGGLSRTWLLEVGGRRGERPGLWEGAGKRASRSRKPGRGLRGGPSLERQTGSLPPELQAPGPGISTAPPSRSSGPRVRRRAGKGWPGQSSPKRPPGAPPPPAWPQRARRLPFPRAAAPHPRPPR